MEWTGLNELRESFLQFFESKEHLRLPSYSLVPDGDKSLLLINSGMAPMKKFFTREVTPPRYRVTTCQKCIRTPDIDNVGHTARHGTYFEMLGNFSFGDYFKYDAIHWAWEFFTEVLEIPADKLYCSVYEDDDEAWDIWTKDVGVPEDHMVRLGKEDNFWEHGSGPCGPCSEIYYDRGEKYGCGRRSGTSSSPSSTTTATTITRRSNTRTSTPVWVSSVWPASCRASTTSSRSIRSRTS